MAAKKTAECADKRTLSSSRHFAAKKRAGSSWASHSTSVQQSEQAAMHMLRSVTSECLMTFSVSSAGCSQLRLEQPHSLEYLIRTTAVQYVGSDAKVSTLWMLLVGLRATRAGAISGCCIAHTVLGKLWNGLLIEPVSSTNYVCPMRHTRFGLLTSQCLFVSTYVVFSSWSSSF